VLGLVADARPDFVLEPVVLASPYQPEELGLVLGPEGLVAVMGWEVWLGERREEEERRRGECEREKRES